jgi:hypothetical protein
MQHTADPASNVDSPATSDTGTAPTAPPPSLPEERAAWVAFAAAYGPVSETCSAAGCSGNSEHAALFADKLLAEYRKRFPAQPALDFALRMVRRKDALQARAYPYGVLCDDVAGVGLVPRVDPPGGAAPIREVGASILHGNGRGFTEAELADLRGDRARGEG